MWIFILIRIRILHVVQSADQKVFRIGTVRYNWPMSAHASQGFSIAHCTDSEDLPADPHFTRSQQMQLETRAWMIT